MVSVKDKKIEDAAWRNPAPGNEQNDRANASGKDTIKNGGNSSSQEDALDLDRTTTRKKDGNAADGQDYNEDPDEQSFK